MPNIIGVTGHKGRLGSMLLQSKQLSYVPLDCDITNFASIENALDEVQPDIVINCAAYTNVDDSELESTKTFAVNTDGVLKLREAFDGWLIHLSTDYIFGGFHGPYSERFDVKKDMAQGVYGKSKAHGEGAMFGIPDKVGTIIRTTMLYGNPKFSDFVNSVLEQLDAESPFEVPYTLLGSPTYIPHLIDGIDALITKHCYNPPSIVNIAGADILSRYDFALMIASIFEYNKNLILPVRTIRGLAKRPRKAGLKINFAKKLRIPIHSALEGLEAYAKRMCE